MALSNIHACNFSAKRKKKTTSLIVDRKTDIPIFELKMNMQVTQDITNQSSQVADIPKKAKLSDGWMQTPGKDIPSEKSNKR